MTRDIELYLGVISLLPFNPWIGEWDVFSAIGLTEVKLIKRETPDDRWGGTREVYEGRLWDVRFDCTVQVTVRHSDDETTFIEDAKVVEIKEPTGWFGETAFICSYGVVWFNYKTDKFELYDLEGEKLTEQTYDKYFEAWYDLVHYFTDPKRYEEIDECFIDIDNWKELEDIDELITF